MKKLLGSEQGKQSLFFSILADKIAITGDHLSLLKSMGVYHRPCSLPSQRFVVRLFDLLLIAQLRLGGRGWTRGLQY